MVGAGRSAANQRVRPDRGLEAPGSCPEGRPEKRKRCSARGGGAGPRVRHPLDLREVRPVAGTAEDDVAGRRSLGKRCTQHGDPLSVMEGSGEQPDPQPPNPGDHHIRDGDFVVLKREDVFKAVQVQRRK